MWFDLSHRITDGMPVYPGDLPVSVVRNKHFETDGYNNSVLSFGPHVGTHVDGLMHMSDHPAVIADHDLSRSAAKPSCSDVRGMKEIGPDSIDWTRVAPDDIVLLCTGHDAAFGTGDYFQDHPAITEAFAGRLVGPSDQASGHRYAFPGSVSLPFAQAAVCGRHFSLWRI